MFALVDCNSCYASCEQIFRPDLRGKPVVVLSNNDCFIVVRSKEAKALGVGNLQAFFEIENVLKKIRWLFLVVITHCMVISHTALWTL